MQQSPFTRAGAAHLATVSKMDQSRGNIPIFHAEVHLLGVLPSAQFVSIRPEHK